MRVKLQKNEIAVGEAISWDLCNGQGKVLFKKGFVINTDASFTRLLGLELYHDSKVTANTGIDVSAQAGGNASMSGAISPSDTPDHQNVELQSSPQSTVPMVDLSGANIIEEIENAAITYKTICDCIVAGKINQLPDLLALGQHLQRIYSHDSDACLAAIHLNCKYPQSLLQPIYSALLCMLGCEPLSLSSVHILVNAALTANLGMYEYYDDLINQQGNLTPQQRLTLQTHTDKSIKLLKSIGVKDTLWLEIVSQHHERTDGKGYPRGLSKNQILTETTVYAFTDTYLSNVMPRAYRERQEPMVVLQRIYKMNVSEDQVLLSGFIKNIGVYPPGSVVVLRNNELALVVKRNRENSIQPTVVSFAELTGLPLGQVVIRDTSKPEYAIVSIHRSKLPPSYNLVNLYTLGSSMLT